MSSRSKLKMTRKVANRFGRCFTHAKETFKLKDLKPGDHIVEESIYGFGITFWHHMIVESVDLDQQLINVIHYYHDMDPLLKWVSVCRTSIPFIPDSFYRIIYEDGECLPPRKVLENAEARIGEKSYNPITNNCEHFASECKTGKSACHQLWTAIEIFGKSAISTSMSFLNRAANWFRMKCDPASSWFRAIRQTGVTEVAKNGAGLSIKSSIFAAFIVELALLAKDFEEAKEKFDKGKITRDECYEAIVKRVCAMVFSIFGSTLGLILGGKALPAVGAFFGVGGIAVIALEVVGAFLGGAVGDFVAKQLGGCLGDLLTPLFIEYLDRFIKYLDSKAKMA